ncbi:ABC transporter permease [Oscillospiraceae bacterium MB08-C2-2]|nr:ABC transporter permease [Oscillospiraceae bacterium MB08-C2-2]
MNESFWFYLAIILNSTLRGLAPILLCTLAVGLCAKVRVFNIAMEGTLLFGCFGAIVGNYWFENLWLALLTAMAMATAFSLLVATFIVRFKVPPLVTGISANIWSAGFTAFMVPVIFGTTGFYFDPEMEALPKLNITSNNMFLRIFSDLNPIDFLSFGIAILIYIIMYKTVVGFRFRAVGENVEAAQSMGTHVNRYKYGAFIATGILCGIAGMQLSLGQVVQFVEGMSGGRGFTALIASSLAGAHPLKIIASSFLFGFANAAGSFLLMFGIKDKIAQLVPYIITLILLIVVGIRQRIKQKKA